MLVRVSFSIEDISCLECLSNELFYEIFEYLDGCDLIQSFSQLNRRLENLIQYSSLPLAVTFTSKSRTKLEENCRNVIVPYKHRIRSLHLYDYSVIRNFFRTCTINDSFTCLESIVISDISLENTIAALFFFKSLPRLSSLTIKLYDGYGEDGSNIFKFALSLPTLKYLNISISLDESYIEIPMTINSKPSSIERMILNGNLKISDLIAIIQHAPKLKHISCDELVTNDDESTQDESPVLKELTYLSIKRFEADFDEFEYLMKRISSQLQILHLKVLPFRSFLFENRWRQLINKHMPVLHKFHFDCFTGEYDFDYDYGHPVPELFKAFTSSFWTDRNWYVQVTDTNEQYEFSIHSADPEKSNIQLKISEYDANSWYNGYLEKAKPIYEAIEFTHLSIDCTDLLPNLMIEILHLLPQLTSLEVISLPLIYSDDLCLSFAESEMLFSIGVHSKITKMKICQTKTIDFLMNFCPRIQYLEIEYSQDTDLEKIVGCIAVNNRTHICYLDHLCLDKVTDTKKTCETLERCIDFERLLDSSKTSFNEYILEEKNKQILLTWQLLR